ncbi:MAG: OmpH family outer membrane protein [candidate division Zixibacteria bacterium]|nr:OmpH family outer membrane protein [candidate division Zixibacteria bacterium]
MKTGLFLLMLVLFSQTAFGQKIGYVDSDRLKNEYRPFGEAKDLLNNEVKDWQRKTDSLARNIKILEDSLAKVGLILSPEKKKEREDEITKVKKEYQQYLAETFGVGGKVEKRNSELSKPILDKVHAAISEVALENNFDLVLDVVTGSVAYGRKSLDVTDRVLEKLNAALGGKK